MAPGADRTRGSAAPFLHHTPLTHRTRTLPACAACLRTSTLPSCLPHSHLHAFPFTTCLHLHTAHRPPHHRHTAWTHVPHTTHHLLPLPFYPTHTHTPHLPHTLHGHIPISLTHTPTHTLDCVLISPRYATRAVYFTHHTFLFYVTSHPALCLHSANSSCLARTYLAHSPSPPYRAPRHTHYLHTHG